MQIILKIYILFLLQRIQGSLQQVVSVVEDKGIAEISQGKERVREGLVRNQH